MAFGSLSHVAPSDAVYLDRPGYRVTARTTVIGGRTIETARVYTATARESRPGWVRALTQRSPRYELRLLTADGPLVVPVGEDAALAGDLAAAINFAVRPEHWLR